MEPSGSPFGALRHCRYNFSLGFCLSPTRSGAPSHCGNWSSLREESNKCVGSSVLTSPPKYFKRAKLGSKAWLRLFKLWGLWAGLLSSALLIACCAGSRTAGCPWEAMGSYRTFLVAPGGFSPSMGRKEKARKSHVQKLVCWFQQLWRSFLAAAVHFFSTAQLLVSCLQLYAILMVSCSYVFKRKWKGTNFFCV